MPWSPPPSPTPRGSEVSSPKTRPETPNGERIRSRDQKVVYYLKDWIGTFEGHKGSVWSCYLDKHTLHAASASADFSPKLKDALYYTNLATILSGLRIWDVRSGIVVQILETKFPITSAEDLPCKVESASLEPKFGNRFIAGGEDMLIHVFDFHIGEEIGCNKGHHGLVHCLWFSPR
uniref:Serine-threonine kinase receptor-associated protein n=1 Tax=Solanum lycopersicum TaxID=4081 RepID=K4C5Y6_SOLLC